MKRQITFQLRADANKRDATAALQKLVREHSAGDYFVSYTLRMDGTCELRATDREESATSNLRTLAERIDFVLEEHDDADTALYRYENTKHPRDRDTGKRNAAGKRILEREHAKGVSVQARELRQLSRALHEIAAGADPAKVLGLINESDGRPNAPTTVIRDFEIALARHRCGKQPRAAALVATELHCDPSKVRKAYSRFKAFLQKHVDPA